MLLAWLDCCIALCACQHLMGGFVFTNVTMQVCVCVSTRLTMHATTVLPAGLRLPVGGRHTRSSSGAGAAPPVPNRPAAQPGYSSRGSRSAGATATQGLSSCPGFQWCCRLWAGCGCRGCRWCGCCCWGGYGILEPGPVAGATERMRCFAFVWVCFCPRGANAAQVAANVRVEHAHSKDANQKQWRGVLGLRHPVSNNTSRRCTTPYNTVCALLSQLHMVLRLWQQQVRSVMYVSCARKRQMGWTKWFAELEPVLCTQQGPRNPQAVANCGSATRPHRSRLLGGCMGDTHPT
jgi:hypothetical protein